MPVPNSSSFIPSRGIPFTGPTTPAPSTGGSVTKGFAGIPTAHLAVHAIDSARAAAGGASSGLAAPGSSGSAVDRHSATPDILERTPAPLAFAVFLFGPGSDVLQALVNDLVPVLDEESGHALTWVSLTDPRRTRPKALEQHRSMGIPMDNYQREWAEKLQERADVRDLQAEETLSFSRRFNIAIERMPTLVLFPTSGVHTHFDLPLGVRAAQDLVTARLVLDVLRRHLKAERISAALERSAESATERWARVCSDLLADVDSVLKAQDPKIKPNISGDHKRYHVLRRISEGASLKQACEEAGITPQALQKDTNFQGSYAGAKVARKAGKIAARKELGRGKAVRAEDVEADDPEGDLEV